ncbi:nmrA-like family domain-containing protein [Trichoderma breve]|uniref:NmrA-like family domain-containing protein n=1 Tax=Trichoderma breve TaxID=2034170 RepID=A0A9W9BB05_9HYPO|nr:nmrA-like family domain-containing protein [Trichoderma breve]KAJ4859825.1 nmrA-like family domain-containing protein [Trichoderma breve]
MSSFKNIAIAGATGYLGPAVVKAVKEAGFNVTVLLRESNSSKIELDGVKIAKMNYGSIDFMVDALKGQDAVVSTMNHLYYDEQKALVEAAVKAGVKRFLPSEYGLDVSIPSVRAVPYLSAKGLIQDLLKELGMAYTILYTGPFLEWGLDNFFVDWKTATANVWNGGDISVGISTLADTGRAVVNVLLNPKETENKAFYTTTGMATQNEILSAVQEGRPDSKLSIIHQDSKSSLAAAYEAAKAGRGMEFEVARDFLGSTIFGLEIEAGVPYGRDNDLLGIKMVTPEEFRQLVINHVKK